MTNYEVRWTINVDADTPEDAARLAQEIQRDPDSLATVFEVIWHQMATARGWASATIDLAEVA